MMLCPHCKAQWQLPDNIKKTKNNCPFCEGDLYKPMQEPYSFKMVLQELIARFDMDIIADRENMLNAFSLIAPNLEKEVQGLRLFDACGGIDNFLNVQYSTQEEITKVYTNQVEDITNIITEICDGFLAAMTKSNGIPVEVFNKKYSQNVEWEYANLENNTIEITACKNQLPVEIIFPNYIDDKKVVSIGSAALGVAKTKGADRLHVESVVIPEGVETIGSGVFSGCKSLKMVSLPQGLLTIGDDTFKNCKALTSVSIPDSVTYIGCGAFSGSGIKSLVWPGSIASVLKETFKNCKQLLSITILEGVSNIQQSAFSGCNSIIGISLPNSLKTIEATAFHECKKLNDIVLPDTVEYIGKAAFKYCSSLSTINIPEKIKELEYAVFFGCDFSSFVIPENITKIDDDAFGYCWSLTKITIPNSVTKINNDAFFSIKSDVIIVCNEDSYAHKWAKKNKVMFELIQE